MKNILANLLIKLGLDSGEFNQGIESAKSKTNAFGKGIKKLGAMMAAAFSVAAITAFVKSAISAAKEQIRVENELGAAIKANGKDVQSNLSAYKAFASQMQRNSTVGDETTLSLIRLAETMQSNAPMEAAKNAIALSKALGLDLNTATKMAVLAQSELYTMLERYSPSLRNATDATEKAVEYNKLLASGMSMVAAELETTEGKAIQNANAWGDVKENIGAFILNSWVARKAIQMTGDDLTMATSSLKWYEKAWYRVTLQLGKGAEKAKELAKEQEEAAMAAAKTTSEFGNLLGEVTVSAEEYNKRVKAAYDKWEKNNEKVGRHLELLELINDSFSDYERKINSFEGIDLTAKTADTSGITDGIKRFGLEAETEDNLEIDTAKRVEYLNNFKLFVSDMKYAVADFGTSVVDEFGMAIGQFVESGEFPEDFGKNIIGIIGSFISELGKMLIGLGTASEAFQKLMASGFLAGGIPLIIAGAALVLLGGAISGFAKSKSSGGSSSSGVTTSAYSSANNSGQTHSTNGTVEFVIKGNTLVGVLENQNRKNGLIG